MDLAILKYICRNKSSNLDYLDIWTQIPTKLNYIEKMTEFTCNVCFLGNRVFTKDLRLRAMKQEVRGVMVF